MLRKIKNSSSTPPILTDQAKEAEQTGKSEDAIKHYLKLVDVFLVLASEAPDHNTWMQYIRQPEAYQTRIRSLVPKDQPTQDIVGRIPPPPSERSAVQTNVRRTEPSSVQPIANSQNTSASAARPSPISKILKPFQGRENSSNEEISSVQSLLNPNFRQAGQTPGISQQTAQPQVSPAVGTSKATDTGC